MGFDLLENHSLSNMNKPLQASYRFSLYSEVPGVFETERGKALLRGRQLQTTHQSTPQLLPRITEGQEKQQAADRALDSGAYLYQSFAQGTHLPMGRFRFHRPTPHILPQGKGRGRQQQAELVGLPIATTGTVHLQVPLEFFDPVFPSVPIIMRHGTSCKLM